MGNLLKSIGTGIIAFMFLLSCTNEANQDLELNLLKDAVEIIANPYAMSGADAIATADVITNRAIESETESADGLLLERITSVNTVSTRSGSTRQAYTSSKNYSVRIEEDSKAGIEVMYFN